MCFTRVQSFGVYLDCIIIFMCMIIKFHHLLSYIYCVLSVDQRENYSVSLGFGVLGVYLHDYVCAR